jgi:hypothetical protein
MRLSELGVLKMSRKVAPLTTEVEICSSGTNESKGTNTDGVVFGNATHEK